MLPNPASSTHAAQLLHESPVKRKQTHPREDAAERRLETYGSETGDYNGSKPSVLKFEVGSRGSKQVVSTHAYVTIEGLWSTSEIGTRKHGDRAALASHEGSPDFSGSSESDTEEGSGDSRKELHACT